MKINQIYCPIYKLPIIYSEHEKFYKYRYKWKCDNACNCSGRRARLMLIFAVRK